MEKRLQSTSRELEAPGQSFGGHRYGPVHRSCAALRSTLPENSALLAVCLKSVTPLFAQHGIVNLHHASAQAALRCRAIAVLQWRLRTSLAQRTMGPKTRSSNESIASRGSHSSRNLGDRQRDSQRGVTGSRQTTAGLGSPTPREAPDLREPQLEPRGRRQDVRRTALTRLRAASVSAALFVNGGSCPSDRTACKV